MTLSFHNDRAIHLKELEVVHFIDCLPTAYLMVQYFPMTIQ